MAELDEARHKISKKWNGRNKGKQRVCLYRSHAKKFVGEVANEDDLEELCKMINEGLSNM